MTTKKSYDNRDRRAGILLWAGLAVLTLTIVVVLRGSRLNAQGHGKSTNGGTSMTISTLPALLSLSVDSLEKLDLARMNLLCASGLPGAEDLNVSASLAMLDQMAVRVRTETGRHHYRFQRNPEEFEHSEGFFKMLMLAVVLTEDFGVHYAPGKMGTAAEARTGDGFFGDARDVFLHGLTGPNRQGTCSSLPVLHVAVGRRLGYPLRLVTTKGHLFVRWEDAHERFNVEAAGRGVNRFTDDYYRHWPMEVSEEEVKAEGYLKSLSPAEELAVFLSIRGMCWFEAKRYAEAAASFQVAARLAPSCKTYRVMAEDLQQKARSVVADNRIN